MAYQQLQIITGVARGLTRTNESLLIFDDSPDVKREAEAMSHARDDPRVVQLREGILDAVSKTVDLWSTDATIGNVSLSVAYFGISITIPKRSSI